MAENNHRNSPPQDSVGRISTLINNTGSYIETKMALFRVELELKISKLILAMAKAVILMFASLFVMFFICVGIAALLNELTHSSYLGYLIVGVLLALAVVVLLSPKSSFFTKYLKEKIQMLITLGKDDDGDDEDSNSNDR